MATVDDKNKLIKLLSCNKPTIKLSMAITKPMDNPGMKFLTCSLMRSFNSPSKTNIAATKLIVLAAI